MSTSNWPTPRRGTRQPIVLPPPTGMTLVQRLSLAQQEMIKASKGNGKKPPPVPRTGRTTEAAPLPPASPQTPSDGPGRRDVSRPARRSIGAPLAPAPETPPEAPTSGAKAPPATPLARRSPVRPLPLPDAADEPAPAPAKAVRVSGSGIRDAAESRVKFLTGQARQDCDALVTTAKAILGRIERGETPMQEGHFMPIARKLDQTCASLFELYRLLKCY